MRGGGPITSSQYRVGVQLSFSVARTILYSFSLSLSISLCALFLAVLFVIELRDV